MTARTVEETLRQASMSAALHGLCMPVIGAMVMGWHAEGRPALGRLMEGLKREGAPPEAQQAAFNSVLLTCLTSLCATVIANQLHETRGSRDTAAEQDLLEHLAKSLVDQHPGDRIETRVTMAGVMAVHTEVRDVR
jgi:hypothetical protein